MIFYAKTQPPQSIREHTDSLLENYYLLKDALKESCPFMDDRQWQLLKWAVQYHDVGKAYVVFQNKLRKYMNKPVQEVPHNYDIPHSYLSTVLTPYKKLGVEGKEKMRLAHAIAYHHERDRLPDKELKKQVKEAVRSDIIQKLEELGKHMNIPMGNKPSFMAYDLLSRRFTWGHSKEKHEEFLKYVMVKGLLHRLDHAASASVSVEQCVDTHIGRAVNSFLQNKLQVVKRELQQFAEQNSDKHVIALAQTGMGKTEAGLLWLGQDKGFFTLPLRVSINAMFERMRDSSGLGLSAEKGEVGLLHSSSMDYLDMQDDSVDYEAMQDHSRQLSNKLLITTIDQIMKFPFFYRGFEKEYAALAGAKVVIDEMQAYDPKIAALIVRALELIDWIGGKFMIMTATMPKLYLDRITQSNDIKRYPIAVKTFVNDTLKRHRLKLVNEKITDWTQKIKLAGMKGKVLVICNTVSQAISVYQRLDDGQNYVKLLHSMFLQKDRFQLEKEIKQFSDDGTNGIWVTTQLVEASLDIDFDILFTEASTLDSLFQRLGRCYRNRLLDHDKPNIYIFTKDVSGIPYVYDKYLVDKSLELLEPYDNSILKESCKMNLVETLYDPKNLEGSKFLDIFDKTLKALEYVEPYGKDRGEAQNALRDIYQIRVIPRNIFVQIHETLILPLEKETNKKVRQRLRREIDRHSVSVNYHRAKGSISRRELPRSLQDFAIIDLDYAFADGKGTGLNFDKLQDDQLANFMS